VIIYRLTIHPLAKYPGDLIDRISDWRLIFDCYTGYRHLRVVELHKKYGKSPFEVERRSRLRASLASISIPDVETDKTDKIIP
jgi:hypothetical protein